MIDETKVKQYEATMALHSWGIERFWDFLCNELIGKSKTLQKSVFNEAVEFLIAKWNRLVELCESYTIEQKEILKISNELFIRLLSICSKDILKKQGRLV